MEGFLRERKCVQGSSMGTVAYFPKPAQYGWDSIFLDSSTLRRMIFLKRDRIALPEPKGLTC